LRLLHIFPSFELGGAQARFAQIANHLGHHFEHTLIALDGNEDARRLVDRAVALQIVEFEYDKRSQLQSLFQFRRELEQRPHDLLLTYNWGAVDWALANRLRRPSRHLHFEDGFGPDEAERQLPRRVWFRRIALTGRHTIVVVPSLTLKAIAHDVWSLSDERVSYVPNGIDCARFCPGGAKSSHSDRVLIGTVASLRPEKNVSRLIEAFGVLCRTAAARLLIVGDGPERRKLERLCDELGLSHVVEFAGATTTPEHFYRTMDIFVLSSDTEQMPYSVLEAMATGLPIVSTDVGDVAHMVSEANRAFVVRERSPSAFAAAMLRLVNEPSLRSHVGAENRLAASKRFDLELMLARYSSLFEGRSLA
jgi:glycosyltransferase involved in cell wall biosynthesis